MFCLLILSLILLILCYEYSLSVHQKPPLQHSDSSLPYYRFGQRQYSMTELMQYQEQIISFVSYSLFSCADNSTPTAFYLHIQERMELHTAHPLAQVSGKTFETNETNTTPPSLCADIQRHSLGLYRKWSNTKEGHIIPHPSFQFLLVVFQTSSQKRIKRICLSWPTSYSPLLYRASNRRIQRYGEKTEFV